jgi:hypothetical protein
VVVFWDGLARQRRARERRRGSIRTGIGSGRWEGRVEIGWPGGLEMAMGWSIHCQHHRLARPLAPNLHPAPNLHLAPRPPHPPPRRPNTQKDPNPPVLNPTPTTPATRHTPPPPTSQRGPQRSNTGPIWTPPQKATKMYSDEIQPTALSL